MRQRGARFPRNRPALKKAKHRSEPAPDRSDVVGPSKPRLWRILGPGLITGAADDDPSGIATYGQARAQFGFALGWTPVLTYPLMAVIQSINACIGRTTRHRRQRQVNTCPIINADCF